MVEKETMILVALSIVMLVAASGCLGGGGGSDATPMPESEQRDFSTQGTISLLAQAQPVSRTEEVHFDIGSLNTVTNITITVRVQDGDEGTNPDSVDGIRAWRENGGEPDDIIEEGGGQTPFETSVTFSLTGDENMFNWWIVELTVTCNGGDDTWPGPLIWRGVPDNGVSYEIDAVFFELVNETSVT